MTISIFFTIWLLTRYLSLSIANDEDEGGIDDNSVNVIDIVDAFSLQEVTLTKG